MRLPGSGNGFVRCAHGHTHWGTRGAAGLLLGHAGETLLQHRAPWTHEGGTWSVTGGARDSGEDVVTAALRESSEEAGLAAADVLPIGWSVADHDGWSYTTVVAVVPPGRPRPDPHARNAESSEVRWWPDTEIARLPLHAGFAVSWELLQVRPAALVVVVDVANLMGSRPDGWWRDRAGAAARWWAQLVTSVAQGWARVDLPDGVDPGPLDALTPRLRLVLEGRAREVTPPAEGPAWARALVTPVHASGNGDDAVVAEAEDVAGSGDQLLVVTADRELRARVHDVAPHAVVVGPRSWPGGRPVSAVD